MSSLREISNLTNCPDCPLSERRGFLNFCRHYERGCMEDHDHRPEYCKVEKITIGEGE
jgi:hypothetical protein